MESLTRFIGCLVRQTPIKQVVVFSAFGIVAAVTYGTFKYIQFERIPALFLRPSKGHNIIFGHRGMGAHSSIAPENSLQSFEEAKRHDFAGVEFDICLTKDKHPVVQHDLNMTRTTTGSGSIRDLNLADLISIRLRHNEGVSNQKIPTLYEAVEKCLELNLKILFDIKGMDFQKTADIFHDLFKRYPRLYEESFVSSFNPFVIYLLRRRDEKIVTGLTWRPGYCAYEDIHGAPRFKSSILLHYTALIADFLLAVSQEHFLWRLIGNSVFVVHAELISRASVEKWQSRGIQLMPWSVNSAEQRLKCEQLSIPFMIDVP